MEHKFKLSAHGPQLWTRDKARTIRELEKMLHEASVGDVVVIDAKGVEVFDYSFANELFGKSLLALPREYPDRFLIVENLTTYTRENLCKAMESLGLAIINRRGSQLELIGKVHTSDEETFRAVARSQRPLTAAELKDKLEVNLTAMNERLSKLTTLGIVRRAKSTSAAGREQFEYTVLR